MSGPQDQHQAEFLAQLTTLLTSTVSSWTEAKAAFALAQEAVHGVEASAPPLGSVEIDAAALTASAEAIREAVTEPGSDLLGYLQHLEVDAGIDALHDALEAGSRSVADAAGRLEDAFAPEAWERLDAAALAFDAVEDKTSALHDDLEERRAAAAGRIQTLVTSLRTQGQAELSAVLPAALDEISPVMDEFFGEIDAGADTGPAHLVALAEVAEQAATHHEDTVQRVASSITDAAGEEALEALRHASVDEPKRILGRFDEATDDWASLYEAALPAAQAVPDDCESAERAYRTVAEGLESVTESLAKASEPWRSRHSELVGLGDALGDAETAAADLHARLDEQLTTWTEQHEELAANLVEAVSDAGTSVRTQVSDHARVAESVEQALQNSREAVEGLAKRTSDAAQQLGGVLETTRGGVVAVQTQLVTITDGMVSTATQLREEATRHRQRVTRTVDGLSSRIRGEFTAREQQVAGGMAAWLDSAPVQTLESWYGGCQSEVTTVCANMKCEVVDRAEDSRRFLERVFGEVRTDVVDVGRDDLEQIFSDALSSLTDRIWTILVHEAGLMALGATTTSSLAPVLPHLMACYHALGVIEAALKLKDALPFF